MAAAAGRHDGIIAPMMTAQLTLDLGSRTAVGREDFLVAPNNAEAVAWIDRWPDWPGPALVLCGPPGCGKTHLAQVWRTNSDAALLSARAVAGDPGSIIGAATNCIVEDADKIGNETSFLHLYNHLAACGGSLLLCASMPPSRWETALADLSSRLRAAPVASIGAPDDALIQAVLVKLFADRQLAVAPEVVSYLMGRIERSFDGARRVVAALDGAALAAHRRITVPLASQVLDGG